MAPENASNLSQRAGQEPDGCTHLYTRIPFSAALSFCHGSCTTVCTGTGGNGTDENRKTGAPVCLQCCLQLGMVVKWALLVTAVLRDAVLAAAELELELSVHPALPM